VNERRADRALRLRRDQPGSVRYTRPAVVPTFDQREPMHFPRGDLRCADVDKIRTVAKQVWPDPASRRRSRDRGLYKLAALLVEHPGDTWQQRWDASPLGDGQIAARAVGGGGAVGTEYTQGVQTLFALRIVRPTLVALRINQLPIYPQYVVPAEHDDGLNRFAAAVSAVTLSDHFKRWALFDVCAAMTSKACHSPN
jgi:hypothetical protein